MFSHTHIQGAMKAMTLLALVELQGNRELADKIVANCRIMAAERKAEGLRECITALEIIALYVRAERDPYMRILWAAATAIEFNLEPDAPARAEAAKLLAEARAIH